MTKARFTAAALVFVAATAIAAPANAQLLARKDISLDIALTIATTAVAACKANGFAVSVTVVGRNGEVIVQVRGDGTGPHTMENSMRKAYTSRTLRVPSGDFEKRVKDNPTIGLAQLSNMIGSRGALPIKVGNEVIGAVGASGAPGGDKDEACVQAGLDKVADQLK